MDERFLEHAASIEQASRDQAVRQSQRALMTAGCDECQACGEAIAGQRRQALPSATRCLPCQQAAELLQQGRAR